MFKNEQISRKNMNLNSLKVNSINKGTNQLINKEVDDVKYVTMKL